MSDNEGMGSAGAKAKNSNNNNNSNNSNNSNNNANNEAKPATFVFGSGAPAKGTMARKFKTRKNRLVSGKAKKTSTMSARNRNKQRRAKAKAKTLQEARIDPRITVYKKLGHYRSEAALIDSNEEPSIDKAKKLVSLIEKLYYRMPTPELKEIVEVEMDVHGLVGGILDVYYKILDVLEKKTNSGNAKMVDALVSLLSGMGL
jgi:hypothetical protein